MLTLTKAQRAQVMAELIDTWYHDHDDQDLDLLRASAQNLDPWVVNAATDFQLMRRLSTTTFESAQGEGDLPDVWAWAWPLMVSAPTEAEQAGIDYLADPWYEPDAYARAYGRDAVWHRFNADLEARQLEEDDYGALPENVIIDPLSDDPY